MGFVVDSTCNRQKNLRWLLRLLILGTLDAVIVIAVNYGPEAFVQLRSVHGIIVNALLTIRSDVMGADYASCSKAPSSGTSVIRGNMKRLKRDEFNMATNIAQYAPAAMRMKASP